MPRILRVSNSRSGLETGVVPFNIDNDAFAKLINMYVWRGRVKKKRGTTQLGRLERKLTAASLGNTLASPWTITLISALSLNSGAVIKPGSVTVTIAGPITFTDNGDGTLSSATPGNSGTINYSTATIVLTHTAGVGVATTITFSYYPCLPVMGLEDFNGDTPLNPTLVALDTVYSYQFNQTTSIFYDVSFYKNTGASLVWSGQNYQQFWSENFQGAMWVTNGVTGFHYKDITAVPAIGANTQFTIANHGLTNNDYVYINEVGGVTGVNGVSGIVTVVDANNFTIPTPGAGGAYTSGGIAQYLTRSVSGKGDGIRWYDGDPIADPTKGWVNFAPPISNAAKPYYLVGCDLIVQFKDRLLFFGPYIQLSGGAAIQKMNQVFWCENGTGYYANPTPVNQTVDNASYYQNVVGKGGFQSGPSGQKIITVSDNEDVLLCGYSSRQTKLLYTGDDSNPFIFQTINTEIGSQSTFSGISLDVGTITIGNYGIALTTQTSSQRIDLQIPDQIFSIGERNNGSQRVTSIRDFRNEFIYFTYPYSNNQGIFPNQTLLYNYRENNWAVFEENYTKYGTFRKTTGYTWATLPYKTWASWTVPWNFGSTAPRYPSIIGGNQHGFVMMRIDETREDSSQYISAASGTTITSPNHCLNDGDFILISGCIGGTSTALNGTIQKITYIDANSFGIENTTAISGYVGGGVYSRLTNISVLTKQFPVFWDDGKQTRFGTQKFLFETTSNGEVTVDVYCSQNDTTPTNDPQINPYLIFSNIVATHEEGSNFSATQNQIWHRISNSLIGDTIQFGLSLSDDQMRSTELNTSEITLHEINVELHPGPVLANIY